jgi:ankyrin repeat protein
VSNVAEKFSLGGDNMAACGRHPSEHDIPTSPDAQRTRARGVSVTIINTKTYEARAATTNDEGVYHFDSLTPGTYDILVEAKGFDANMFEKVVLQQGVEQRQDSLLALPGTKPARTEEAEEQPEEEGRKDEAKDGAACAADAGDVTLDAKQITNLPLRPEGEAPTTRPHMMGMVAVIRPDDPLVKAVYERDTRAAKNLIALGADVNVLDKSVHTTALMQAVSNGDAEMVSALISAGADVNMKDTDGDTALTSLGEGATAEMARALIQAGAKVNHKNDYGETPLIGAAENDTPEVLKELLEAGAKVNAKSKAGRTALMAAAEYGLIENIKLLLDAGADVNLKDKEGDTALKLAKDYGAEEDDSEEAEESNQSAQSNQSKKIVALLVSYGAID